MRTIKIAQNIPMRIYDEFLFIGIDEHVSFGSSSNDSDVGSDDEGSVTIRRRMKLHALVCGSLEIIV